MWQKTISEQKHKNIEVPPIIKGGHLYLHKHFVRHNMFSWSPGVLESLRKAGVPKDCKSF